MSLVQSRYNLLTNYPDVAKQWHPKRNGVMKPGEFTPGTNMKVWWLCNKNPDHEWEASISNRTKGRGCPQCARDKKR